MTLLNRSPPGLLTLCGEQISLHIREKGPPRVRRPFRRRSKGNEGGSRWKILENTIRSPDDPTHGASQRWLNFEISISVAFFEVRRSRSVVSALATFGRGGRTCAVNTAAWTSSFFIGNYRHERWLNEEHPLSSFFAGRTRRRRGIVGRRRDRGCGGSRSTREDFLEDR